MKYLDGYIIFRISVNVVRYCVQPSGFVDIDNKSSLPNCSTIEFYRDRLE